MKRIQLARKFLSWAVLFIMTAPFPASADRYKPFGDELSTRHWPPDRSYDLQHIRLDLTFDWDQKKVSGKVTYRLVPLNSGFREVRLNQGDLNITGVTDAAQKSLVYAADDSFLVVKLPEAYDAGKPIEFSVAYWAKPRKGLYFVGPDSGYPTKPKQIWSQGEDEDNHFWFPCWDFPNDRATSEMVATVPETWTVVSNGRLVEVKPNPAQKTKTFHYSQEQPHVTYLISVVAGEFEKYADDFDGTPVEYYVPLGTGEAKARRSFGITPDAVKFFSEKIGFRYPYAKYAQSAVTDFIYGGMENISATTQTDRTLHAEVSEPVVSSEGLVAHELAHQWWGDLVTCNEWAHAWLNEGFATYFASLYTEHHRGKDEFQYEMLNHARAYISEDENEYRRPIVDNWYTDSDDLFDSHLYPKGGWVLHMLRGMLGDNLFWKGINNYAKTYAYQTVTTREFQKVMEEATGRSLGWFFDQWVYKGGYPRFEVHADWDEEHKVEVVKVKQTQTPDTLTPVFRAPLIIELVDSSGTRSNPVEITQADQQFTFPASRRPLEVRFDPGNTILKTLDFPKEKKELFYQVRFDPDVVARIWACGELGKKFADPEVVDTLAAVLTGDSFYGVRGAAASALGKLQTGAAEKTLYVGYNDKDARVRRAAVDALGEFKESQTATDFLKKVIAGDPNDYVKASAVSSIGRIAAPGAFEILKQALRQPSEYDVVRTAAAGAFGTLKDKKAIDLLMPETRYGKTPSVRTAAIGALGKVGKEEDSVTRRLLLLLNDPWLWVRGSAMDALAELKIAEAIPAIEGHAQNEPDGRLRKQARNAIKRIREGKAETEDMAALRSELERLKSEQKLLRDRIEVLEKHAP